MWREAAVAININDLPTLSIIELDVKYIYRKGIKKGMKAFPDLKYIRVGRVIKVAKTIYTKEGKMKKVPLSEFSNTALLAQQKP